MKSRSGLIKENFSFLIEFPKKSGAEERLKEILFEDGINRTQVESVSVRREGDMAVFFHKPAGFSQDYKATSIPLRNWDSFFEKKSDSRVAKEDVLRLMKKLMDEDREAFRLMRKSKKIDPRDKFLQFSSIWQQ